MGHWLGFVPRELLQICPSLCEIGTWIMNVPDYWMPMKSVVVLGES
jgi:hypothetical protein